MTLTINTTDNLNITAINTAYLVQMPSKFTAIEAKELKSQIKQNFQPSSTIEKIILDFSQTTFLDSSGLLGLCQIVDRIKHAELNLTFWSFSPEVNMILSLAGLDRIWQAEAGTEALLSFNREKETKKKEFFIPQSILKVNV